METMMWRPNRGQSKEIEGDVMQMLCVLDRRPIMQQLATLRHLIEFYREEVGVNIEAIAMIEQRGAFQ